MTNVSCSINGCYSQKEQYMHNNEEITNELGITFYSLPKKDPQLSAKWQRLIKPYINVENNNGFVIICSKHFHEKAFYINNNTKKALIKNASPTIFPIIDNRNNTKITNNNNNNNNNNDKVIMISDDEYDDDCDPFNVEQNNCLNKNASDNLVDGITTGQEDRTVFAKATTAVVAAHIEKIKQTINKYKETNRQLEDTVKKQEDLLTNLKTMLSYLRQYGNISEKGIGEILLWDIEK